MYVNMQEIKYAIISNPFLAYNTQLYVYYLGSIQQHSHANWKTLTALLQAWMNRKHPLNSDETEVLLSLPTLSLSTTSVVNFTLEINKYSVKPEAIVKDIGVTTDA